MIDIPPKVLADAQRRVATAEQLTKEGGGTRSGAPARLKVAACEAYKLYRRMRKKRAYGAAVARLAEEAGIPKGRGTRAPLLRLVKLCLGHDRPPSTLNRYADALEYGFKNDLTADKFLKRLKKWGISTIDDRMISRRYSGGSPRGPNGRLLAIKEATKVLRPNASATIDWPKGKPAMWVAVLGRRTTFGKLRIYPAIIENTRLTDRLIRIGAQAVIEITGDAPK